MPTLKTLAIATLASFAPLVATYSCEHQWTGPFSATTFDEAQHQRQLVELDAPPLEIRPLFVSGPSSNRNDLIFLGDGYTEDEREKFFEDALFLATNLTDGQTFAEFLPLMNFWAGFSASKESGIGVGGKPLDTVYGLYRQGTELRAIYYVKQYKVWAACASTDACDVAIVVANDARYGGLGGSFSITTASKANGPAVLRHELGHTLIGVGEEYDGGTVYTGINSACAQPGCVVPWEPWLSEAAEEPSVQSSVMVVNLYPWSMLNTSQSWSHVFASAGTYATHLVQFSLSGFRDSDDLRVEMDGRELAWEINPAVGDDRYIYRLKFDEALKAGEHEIRFTLLNSDIEGSAQLCNLEVLEYDANFVFDNDFNGLYPTFDYNNATTYRPTNNKCLMRNMYSVDFCDACVEGLWLNLLEPISFFDHVNKTKQADGSTNVTVDLLALAEFRETETYDEAYSILWYGDDADVPVDEFTNSTTAVFGPDVGRYGVEVGFWTSRIRSYPYGVPAKREWYVVGDGWEVM